jgi:hypothetical protein
MKQGQASSNGSGGQKTEPRVTGVNPGAVGNLGNMQGNHSDRGDMPFKTTPWATDGFHAPSVKGKKVNPSGSQGSY